MMTALSIVLFGFLLGMRHAVDADHVVAVTTIVSREKTVRHAALIGALWGIGHTITVVLVGGVLLLFGVEMPRRTGLAMEFTVALMLIALGSLNLHGLLRGLRERSGADSNHAIPDEADDIAILDQRFGGLKLYQMVRPVIVGVIHGLAGSAAVALLVVPIIDEVQWAVAYLIIFGLGTIAGMMLFTAAIAVPFAFTANRTAPLNRPLRYAAGFLSIGFGLFLACQVGFGQGLFAK